MVTEATPERSSADHDALPYKVKRRDGGYDVIDLATGRTVARIFKYIGGWWVNSAGSLANRHGRKEWAAEAAWKAHTREDDRS